MSGAARALALVLLAAVTAHADGPPTEPPPPPRVVEIGTAGAPAVEEVVRELLAGLPVELRWTRLARIDPREVLLRGASRAAEPRLLARVWLDLSDPAYAAIYLADAASERFIVRFVPLAAGYDEVARESVAHIVESAVDALLAGAEVGVSREVAERQLAAKPGARPPPPRRGPTGTLALVYAAGLWNGAPAVANHGPGLMAFLGHNRARRVRAGFALALFYAVPFAWPDEIAGAAFTGLALRSGIGVEAQPVPRVTLRALAGVGLDALYVQSRPGPDHYPVLPFWVTTPVASLLAVLEVRLVGPLALLAGAGVESDLRGTHYDVERSDGSRQVRLRPWPVRPLFLLGLGAAL